MINKMLIFFVLLVGCSDDSNQNFDILNKKFNEWYSHVYNNEIFINNLDIALRNEFIQDLRRFEFEFSQITQKNLKPDKRKSYNIIIYRIKNLILNHETIDNYNQDPSKITLHFYYQLLNAFESTAPFDINHDIEYLENLISDIEENYTNVFPGVKDRMISDINKSIYLIEIYNTDEFWSTYNKFKDFKILADKFKKLKENLIQLKRWIVSNLSVNDKIVNDDKINIYEKQTENRIQDSYEYSDILKFINSTITSTQNTIFDFSLTIYLKDNDEPIWIDRDDSLGIINFVLNKKKCFIS